MIWNPSVQQTADPDTVWMLDTTAEQAIAFDEGGLIDAYGTFRTHADCDPWRSGGGWTVEAGKFTNGIRGNSNSGSWLFMPGEHLPAGSFTVEFWVKCSANWSTEGRVYLLAFGKNRPDVSGPSVGISCTSTGKLSVQYRHQQSGGAEVNQSIVDTATIVANEWIGVFVTYDGTTLTLYKNQGGSLTTVGAKTVAPAIGWSVDDDRNGLSLLGGKQDSGGGQCANWLISDVRISRVCRVPNQAVTIPDSNTIAFSNTVARPVAGYLNGIVSYFANDHTEVGNTTVEGLVDGIVSVGRTDKILSSIPIKAGSPDATRPTLGHSGSYSYDFRPLEHAISYYTRQGINTYIGLDSTPQILGGSVAPMNSTQCADSTYLPNHTAFSPTVPNDFAAMATICADVYWHVTRTLAHQPIAWGVWNEPTGSSFWLGTSTQFNQMYKAIVDAIVAIDSDVYIGGPDDSIDSTITSSLISYCGANNVVLRHVPVHTYASNFGDFKRAVTRIGTLAAAAGLATPDVLVGEWNWSLGNTPGGRQPYGGMNLFLGSWIASHNAASLIEMQNADIDIATRFAAIPSEATDTGEGTMGLTSLTRRWAPANVLDMWTQLGDDQLTVSSSDVEGGVHALATSSADGTVHVLASNFKWRKDRATDLTVTLPSSVSRGTVSAYAVVDDTRSNYYDSGTGTGALEVVTAPEINSNGQVTIVMQPRSVHLLTIAPQRQSAPIDRSDIPPSPSGHHQIVGRATHIAGLKKPVARR